MRFGHHHMSLPHTNVTVLAVTTTYYHHHYCCHHHPPSSYQLAG
uniref:Uncharacterized protein n=1 Tax=Malus domestica TaxID=3750 RepID=E4Z8Q3_MALDO|nr:hypothetical protein [Malus domestica]